MRRHRILALMSRTQAARILVQKHSIIVKKNRILVQKSMTPDTREICKGGCLIQRKMDIATPATGIDYMVYYELFADDQRRET